MKIKFKGAYKTFDDLTLCDMFILNNDKNSIFIKVSYLEWMNSVELAENECVSAHILKDTIVQQVYTVEMNVEWL